MAELERIDSHDRTDGTPRMKRLRQIPPEVGKFIAILAAAAPAGRWIEIGTSAGYSTLWLALACRAVGRKITTYEILAEKAALARQTFAAAGVSEVVEFVHGDALDPAPGLTCGNKYLLPLLGGSGGSGAWPASGITPTGAAEVEGRSCTWRIRSAVSLRT